MLMQRESLCVCFVVAVPLKSVKPFELSWLTVITLAVVIGLLSIAVIVTVSLVCYYRRRMREVAGTTRLRLPLHTTFQGGNYKCNTLAGSNKYVDHRLVSSRFI